MTDAAANPANTKKKKRSFFADDDFFVRKPKARPAPKICPEAPDKAPGENGPKPEPTPATATAPAPQLHAHTETFVHKQEPGVITPAAAGENGAAASAGQSFDEAETTAEPSHIATSPGAGPSSFHDTNTSFADIPPATISLLDQDILSSLAPLAPNNGPNPLAAEDDDDLQDSDLNEFFSGIAKKSSSVAENTEHDRLYQVKVASRLGMSCEYTKEITGETTFADLLEQLSRDTLRDVGDPDYWKWGVLVWIEGRSELKPFFKPSTLRIPQPAYETTKINCLYIPREHLATFEMLYVEFEQKPEPEEEEFSGVGEKPVDYAGPEEGTQNHDGVPSAGVPSAGVSAEEKDKSEYFVIGLKGKDNKRIEAEVGPTTKIRSILEHFIQTKKIELAPGQRGKIMFEDEELDLDAEVKDTELEEDFEVQIFIK